MSTVLSYLEASDRRVAGRLQGWAPPRWFRVWMIAATHLGDGWLWLGGALFLAAHPHRGGELFAAAAVAATAANAAVVVLKRRFRRVRPRDYAPKALGTHVRPDLFVFDHFSFPSGHALNAFAACALLSLAFPVLTPAALVLASSVSASRVVLRFHFLSDVLAGAVIGAAIGVAVFALVVT